MTANAWSPSSTASTYLLASRSARDHATRFGYIARAGPSFPPAHAHPGRRAPRFRRELVYLLDANPGERATPPLLMAFDYLCTNADALVEPTAQAPIHVGVTFVSPPPKRVSVYPARADLLWG